MLSGPSFSSASVFSISSLIPLTSVHLTEASLSAFLWLYKYQEMSFIYNYSHF